MSTLWIICASLPNLYTIVKQNEFTIIGVTKIDVIQTSPF